MTVHVGTSGWAYASWKPDFYPPKLPQKDFLKFYATQLNAVEVNYTFRRFLSEKIIAGWISQTPEGFQFVLKAHQAITHFRQLKNAGEPLGWFLSAIQPLAAAGRLGPVLFQLPPHTKADARVLDDFLGQLPRSLRAAFEFRHESWFSDEIYDVLRHRNAALCVAESDELITPAVFTALFAYFRLRKTDYSAAERRGIAERVRQQVKDGREVFAFFKHEDLPQGPLHARELLQEVAGARAA